MTPSITLSQNDPSAYQFEQDLRLPLRLNESHVTQACSSSKETARSGRGRCIAEIQDVGVSNFVDEGVSASVSGQRRRFIRLGLPLVAARRVSDWVGKKVNHTRTFLCHHWHLLRTGESASELAIVFSPIVAASSLAYLGPAVCFYATKKLAMTALFSIITFTSLQADSLQPSSKVWCMTDRTFATAAVITGPMRTFLHVASSFDHKVKIAILSTVALSFLAWSRSSKTQAHFVLRHTCWHITSAAALSWMALRSAYLVKQYEASLLLKVAELVA